MKKLFLLTLGLLFGFYLSFSQSVNVTLGPLTPNRLAITDAYKIRLENNSGQALEVFLEGNIEESSAGQVANARSAKFSLPVGVTTINAGSISRIEPITKNYSNREFEKIAIQTGSLPAGDYTICIYVKDASGENELGEHCLTHRIQQVSPPILILPAKEATVETPRPLFSWTPPSPMVAGMRVDYGLRITEVLAGQSMESALAGNPAYFENRGIKSVSYQFPSSSRSLEANRQYAWQVIAYNSGIEIARSEVSGFTYQPIAPVVPTITPDVARPVAQVPLVSTTITAVNAPILSNWDFEAGSYLMWKRTGTAFDAIGERSNAEVTAGYQGQYWATSMNLNANPTPQATGELLSQSFRVSKKYINFLVYKGTELQYRECIVRLLVPDLYATTSETGKTATEKTTDKTSASTNNTKGKGTGTSGNNPKAQKNRPGEDPNRVYLDSIGWCIIHYQAAAPSGSRSFSQVNWDVSHLQGRDAYIQIIDKSTSDYVSADNFTFSDQPDVPLCDNWGFERANLDCWIAEGNAFTNQPTRGEYIYADRAKPNMLLASGGIGGDYWTKTPYPIGVAGEYWIGTYENRSGNRDSLSLTKGNGAMGRLVSSPFRVNKRYIHFLIAGGKDAQRLKVEFRVKEDDYARYSRMGRQQQRGSQRFMILGAATGNNSEQFRRETIDLMQFLDVDSAAIKSGNITLEIAIVDSSSAIWGHISVDDFQFTDTLPRWNLVAENGVEVKRDTNRKVWGFMDSHAHPANYIGFSGGLIAGKPTGSISTALRPCDHIHGPGGTRSALMPFEGNHITGGYPKFEGWPKYDSKTHQQMYIDWIRRAYDGGLRLMSALAVNNMFMASRWAVSGTAGAPEPIFDKENADKQIEAIKTMARENSLWMEIAYTPSDARRIIQQEKLAIILGIELDALGNFMHPSFEEKYFTDAGNTRWSNVPFVTLENNPENAKNQIQAEIDRLYNNGVRQITPLHYISGVWGGTAIFSRWFNVVNHSITGKNYEVEEASPLYSIRYNIINEKWGNDERSQMTATSGIPRDFLNGRTWNENASGSVNQMGLTNYGGLLFDGMMKKGIVIDIDHASYKTTRQVLERAREKGAYPIISSHSDFLELGLTGPDRWRKGDITDDHDRNFANFKTTQIGNLRHEGMSPYDKIDAIRNLGGTVSPIMSTYRRSTYRLPNGQIPVPNNCDGSSKTWCQQYLYAIEKMNGKNVGLSTDRGFINFIGPRFGTYASSILLDENLDELKINERKRQIEAQANGVVYDVPMMRYEAFRFAGTPVNNDGFVSEVFRALAIAYYSFNSHTNWKTADYTNFLNSASRNGRVAEMTAGFIYALTNRTLNLNDDVGGTNWIDMPLPHEGRGHRISAYNVLQRQLGHTYLASGENSGASAVIEPVVRQWLRLLSGNNTAPLRRCISGERDWDINLDGVAHYGMIPDFLQDCKNVGLSHQQLSPLFQSAEDYIEMWEKCERTATRLNQTR